MEPQPHRIEEDMRNKLHEAENQIVEKQMEIQTQRRELEVMKEGNQGKARMTEITEEMKSLISGDDSDNSTENWDEASENDASDPKNLVTALKAKDTQISKLLQVLAEQSNRIEQASTIFADLGIQIGDSDEKLINQKERMDKQKQALVELIDLVTEQSREIENFKQEHHPEVANEANNLIGHASWLANAEDSLHEHSQDQKKTEKRDRESGDKNKPTTNGDLKNRASNQTKSTLKSGGSKNRGISASTHNESSRSSRENGLSYIEKSALITEVPNFLDNDNDAKNDYEQQHHEHQHQHQHQSNNPTHYIIKNNIMCSVM
eukprot:TRINITY_DN5669_c2_g1_i1.p1 TRINITY_DN5669_c2_g1~~TRINITY_DN5669_c2_g1_i1.p1  ORF type:complete len:359 (+),score=62.23 TRINITY_DN5669_c2_g1_i1:118-1077(+)